MTSHLYYSQFRGATFVIHAEAEAVENAETTLAILRGIDELLQHGIRVVLVFGKGDRFEQELFASFGAHHHPETNRLVIPEIAVPRIREERARSAELITGLCQSVNIPYRVLPESVVRAERRIEHESTGVVAGFDLQAIRSPLVEGHLAILGFGGEDGHGRFLHVPSVSLAADLAVHLQSQKLLLLNHADGIWLPDNKGGRQQLSFADMQHLLCLLQRRDADGNYVLAGAVLPKVHASIRAVGGDVSQVHIVSYARLLDEILTRTGVGTMIERQQSHHVDYAREEDLDDVERLHGESQRYTSEYGTPYVKPLQRPDLEHRLSQTLLLKHRNVIVGKLHASEVAAAPETMLIGGFVIGENHQDSQHGQLLLGEALGRFRERGYTRAAAVTASDRAKRLFVRSGATPQATAAWQAEFLDKAQGRYHPDERGEVEVFDFPL